MKALPRLMNRALGRVMHDYAMLDDGDRVLVAVSGGVDSLFLAWLLDNWRHKAPISYDLLAIHLDMGFGTDEALRVAAQLRFLRVPFLVEKTEIGPHALTAEEGRSACYHCARLRRNRLFDLAAELGCTKIAFGHHKEDIIETVFLNMFYGGNISTMVPRQEIFDGRLALIRPMAYLEKQDIVEESRKLGIEPVANPCPLSGTSKRVVVRNMLNHLFEHDPRLKSNIFASLANVRQDYLLTPGSVSR